MSNCVCVDHVYTLGRIIQGIQVAGLTMYCFFLDVYKTYDSVWQIGLLKTLREIGNRKDVEDDENMTECARSTLMLDGGISNYFDISQGLALGCTSLPNFAT